MVLITDIHEALAMHPSELSPVQTVLLCTIPLLPASQREAETQEHLVLKLNSTEPWGYQATLPWLNKVVGKQRRLKALSLLPPESPFFCFRDQSLLREELSGLKQLEHPWESGSKTVGNSWPRPNRSAQALRMHTGGGLEELPTRGKGRLISQLALCAKVSLTVSLASWPSGGKDHVLMKCDREGMELGS